MSVNETGPLPTWRRFHLSTLLLTALFAAASIPSTIAWFMGRYGDNLDHEPARFFIAVAIFVGAAFLILYTFALLIEVVHARREVSRQRQRLLDGISADPKAKSQEPP